jgi:2-phosphosulfolactate phosphatase
MTARASSIDVAFTPADMRPARVAVMVDVLRASSTVVAALAAGYRHVLFAGIDESIRLRKPGRVLAGERRCRRIEGFDLGNSPRGLAPARAQELVLCTTNGTPALLTAAAGAHDVLVGCLLNFDALVAAIPRGDDVAVVCAGTDGRFALEDAYVAGRIVAHLDGEPTDAARAAERLAAAYCDPGEPLAQSADAAVLRATGQEEDIAFCARESTLETVPRVQSASGGVAVVGLAETERHRAKTMDNPLTFA